MKRWEYRVEAIRDGGEENWDLAGDMDRYGHNGWEFCEWVTDWVVSEGPGPDTRQALFKRER